MLPQMSQMMIFQYLLTSQSLIVPSVPYCKEKDKNYYICSKKCFNSILLIESKQQKLSQQKKVIFQMLSNNQNTFQLSEDGQTKQSASKYQINTNKKNSQIQDNKHQPNDPIGYSCNEEYTIKLTLIFFIRALMAIITLLSFEFIPTQTDNNFIKMCHQNLQNFYLQIQAIAATSNIASLIIALYFYFDRISPKSRIQKLTNYKKKLLEILQILVEINLHISALLSLLDMYRNVALFGLAALMTIYSCIFLENYIQRADYFYCSEPLANFFFKGWICFQYIMIIILVHIQALIILAAAIGILTTILLIWFIITGIKMYIHREVVYHFIILISFYCAVGLETSISVSLGRQTSQLGNLAQVFLFIVVLIFVLNLCNQQKIENVVIQLSTNAEHIRKLDLLLFEMDSWAKFTDKSSQIIGFIQMHSIQNCPNLKCFSHQTTKQYASQDGQQNPQQQKEAIRSIKLLLKCLYEQTLLTNFNPNFILTYCEFMLNQFRNPTILMQQLTRLQTAPLSIFQRMQLNRMKSILFKENQQLNKTIYNGNLDIQKLITAETSYQRIETQISDYIHNNITLWQTILENEVDLTFIRNKIKLSEDIEQNIVQSWSSIAQYFSINQIWRFTYLCFVFLIRNQKLKMKEIEEFGLQPKINSIFKDKDIYIERESENQIFKNKQILFNMKTCCFHAALKNNSLIITRLSRHFSKIMLYRQQEIIGCKIDVLLPINLRQKHLELVSNWTKQRSSSHEDTYKIQFSSCLTGQGNQISVIKYYKTLLNLQQSDIEYVCMLNKNEKSYDYQRESSSLLSLNNERINEVPNDINFTPENNIFFKEESFQSVKQINQIRDTRWIMRAYLLLLITTVLVLALLTSKQSKDLIAYAQQYTTFMQIYRLPMILGVNYYKYLLKIGNATKIALDVTSNLKLLTDMTSSNYALKTLFDENIYKDSYFYPTSKQFIGLKEVDQVELFFLIESSLVSLSKLPVNESSIDFLNLRNYILPGFNTVMNNTKNQIHYSLSKIFEDIKTKHITTSIIQGILAAIFVFVAYRKITLFFHKMKSMIQTILCFNSEDLENIVKYWNFNLLFFDRLKDKNQASISRSDKQKSSISKANKKAVYFNQEASAVNLNKRNKILHFQHQFYKLKLRLVLPIISIIIITSLIIIAFELNIISKFDSLIIFQESGYLMTKFFPSFPILSYGIMQKSHSLLKPDDHIFSIQKYENIFAAAELFTSKTYFGSITDQTSDFYTKQKNYFQGNPCLFNPSITIKTGYTVKECQTFLNSSFTRGIAAVMRKTRKLAELHIRGLSMMNSTQINEFTVSTSVSSNYLFDLIASWGNEFNLQVQQLSAVLFNIISLSIVFLLYLIFEVLFIRQFRREYNIYRYSFNKMVPQFVLIKQKVIKQKFISDQIIAYV